MAIKIAPRKDWLKIEIELMKFTFCNPPFEDGLVERGNCVQKELPQIVCLERHN